jgi:hypothetical protein
MKPYDKVTSLRGANTLLQGQQINGQDIQRREHRRQINGQIKAVEQRNQDRSETQRQRVITQCKKRL